LCVALGLRLLVHCTMKARAMVSQSELARMKASVAKHIPSTAAEDKRMARKQMSDARKQRWPNTLEAMRAKKENAMADRETVIERERQEIDRQEAELQKNSRMTAIERANRLLYDQTDKMKNLRSQQLYSDVIEDRQIQIQEKQLRANMNNARGEKYLRIQQQLIVEGDRKEEAEAEKRQQKNALIAAQQQEQLQAFKENYIRELRLEKEEGEAIKTKVEADLIKEKEEALRRRREAKQAALDTKIANEQLKQIRLKLLAEEDNEELKRQMEARKKENLMQRRTVQEKSRFDERLRIKQRMIDRATAQLIALGEQNDQREEKQAQEVRDAEDAEMARRADRRAKQQQAIDRSRNMQLDMKQMKKTMDSQSQVQMAHHWNVRNQQVEEEEKAEEIERRQRNVRIRQDQERQMADKRRVKMEERAAKLLADEQTVKMMGEEDERFQRIAQEEMMLASGEGKNLVTLSKAVMSKDKTIMAVGGIRV